MKKSSSWHSCNIFQPDPAHRRIWQFHPAGGDSVNLAAELSLDPDKPVPRRLGTRDWHNLFQRKLNVAWLPPETIFIRVVHLPVSDDDELHSMVELQLEKLSPLPAAQVVWSYEALPEVVDSLQTVVVLIAERRTVETFLGQLEQESFLADRLELPLLGQVLAASAESEGTWLFPGPDTADSQAYCVAAWWYGGTLRSVNFIRLQSGDRKWSALREQLSQIAWAGEMEGWLPEPPRWRLVADAATADAWKTELAGWAGEPIEVTEPLSPPELATLSAKKLARGETRFNLLPGEYALRYRQQFIDGLWMRGLAAVIAVYIVFVIGYFGALQVLRFKEGNQTAAVAGLEGAFKKARQKAAELQVRREQVKLQTAALDCWRVAAEMLPSELKLTSLSFQNGEKLSIYGEAPGTQQGVVTDYSGALSRARVAAIELDAATGETNRIRVPLFAAVNAPNIQSIPGRNTTAKVRWGFVCVLKGDEAP